MSNILIKFPSRERPRKFRDCLGNILSTISNKHNYLIYATLDEDDTSMKWVDGLGRPNIKHIFGTSKNKIDAVNRDMDVICKEFDWDILVLMSDDMLFVVNEWDDIIVNNMTKEFPCILHHATDNMHGERIITMPILNRLWYNEFGYIYNPIYESLYADDEQTEVSKRLGYYKKCKEKIAVHLNFIYTNEKPDNLFIKTQAFEDSDKIKFEKRKALNFQ